MLSRLPPAGQRFVARFRRTQPEGKVAAYAVYATESTEVLLDAIAHSDGKRASVLDRLFATRVHDGLIGDFGFDRNGDVDPGLDTLLRVTSGRGSADIDSTAGSVVDGVAKVPPDGF